MYRKFVAALIACAALFCYAPAKADIIYNLSFTHFGSSTVVGTGVLELNYATVAAAANKNQALDSILVSITTTDLAGHGIYSITPANLAAGSIYQTGAQSQIFTLTAHQSGSAANVLFLDLTTNSWRLFIGQFNGPTGDQGAFTISTPSLAPVAVPGPIVGAGLPGLIAAGAALVALARRRRQRA